MHGDGDRALHRRRHFVLLAFGGSGSVGVDQSGKHLLE